MFTYNYTKNTIMISKIKRFESKLLFFFIKMYEYTKVSLARK